MARAAQRKKADRLETYWSKRRFDETPEPKGRTIPRGGDLYTIQKHAATRLHYDLRLELDGVLLSWAVTRGPSLDPSTKRLAVRTEDHPLDYAMFEGRIPEGNYGAGTVLLWDRGAWEPVDDPHEGLARGKLAFRLDGERLKGRWALVRMRDDNGGKRENWLLIKELDDQVDREADVTALHDTSVVSGRDLEEIAEAPEAVWEEGGERKLIKPKKKKRKLASLPEFISPQLATLVDEIPAGEDWLFEIKFDGYRAIAAVTGEEVTIFTRTGLDWTNRYRRIARALARLDLDGALIDGEIVVVDDDGRSDFGLLQEALKEGTGTLSFFAFDLLAEGGKPLLRKPLRERKDRLRELLAHAGRRGPVFFTDHLEGNGRAMFDSLCRSGFEGVIAKRSQAPYRSGRTRSWLKIKCGRNQEFIIVGWAPSSATRRPFASILVGVHEGDELRYAGKVGAGFSEKDLAELSARFRKLARKTPPVEGKLPRAITREANWVAPELVAEIAFAEFTRDGLVRHGRFIGLRQDKPARTVSRETPKPVKTVARKSASGDTVAGVRLTNPDRVLFPRQGITKLDLAAYLDAVAERMLPYVAGRLVSFVRCPEGRGKECFFQRHRTAGMSEHIHLKSVRKKRGGREEYLYLNDRKGLIAAAQMGVLEFHIWGSRIDKIEKPDRIVFDLDPDPSVDFAEVKRAAGELRDALEALGLTSFALLTGGKGIHVVAPIARRHEWPVVKAFTKALAEHFSTGDPSRFVATMTKARRKGRIFIDHFRNERTATAIAPYSTRAREGAPLAWPVGWDELEDLPSANCIRAGSFGEWLSRPDPWAGYRASTRQGLKAAALRALGIEPA